MSHIEEIRAVEPMTDGEVADARDFAIAADFEVCTTKENFIRLLARLDRAEAALATADAAGFARGVEAAVGAVKEKAEALDDKKCCGIGVYGYGGGPPECCDDPLLMLSDRDAERSIRALLPRVPS